MKYLAERKDATASITEAGMAVIFCVGVSQTFNGVTGKNSSTLPLIEYPVSVLQLEFENKEIDGTQIKRGDRKLMMAFIEGAPEPVADKDFIRINGQLWQVKNSKPFSPDGNPIFYDLQVRR